MPVGGVRDLCWSTNHGASLDAPVAGVKLERTAEYQCMQLKRMNHDIPVEQALRTKGA